MPKLISTRFWLFWTW